MTTEPPKRRWFQFRLRTLLIVVLVLSMPLSWFAWRMERARRQRAAVEAIEQVGGYVGYNAYPIPPPGMVRVVPTPKPSWLRNLLGIDFFENVVYVFLPNGDASDFDLEQFKGLPNLRELRFKDPPVSVDELEHLREIEGLQILGLPQDVTSADVERLQEALPNCKIDY